MLGSGEQEHAPCLPHCDRGGYIATKEKLFDRNLIGPELSKQGDKILVELFEARWHPFLRRRADDTASQQFKFAGCGLPDYPIACDRCTRVDAHNDPFERAGGGGPHPRRRLHIRSGKLRYDSVS